jgi:DNA polymerase-3 subunit delta'
VTAWRVFGQQPAVASLQHALESGRLSHAYLFTGPEGVGKRTLAIRLAQALLCPSEDEAVRPCLECRDCKKVEAAEAPDVEFVTIGGPCDIESHRDHRADGSTRIRICQVRRLQRLANLAPFHAPRRIFIVDTADDMQTEAATALLKTLEEPPETVLLVLLATDPDQLLPTIRSRCQELALRPMPHPALVAALREELQLDAGRAEELAIAANGRYGLAARLLRDPSMSQLYAAALDDLRRLVSAGRNERFDHAETLARRWYRDRGDVIATLDAWRGWWRALLYRAGTEATPPVPAPVALRGLEAVQRTRTHLRENTSAQLALEVLMLDLPVLAVAPEGEEARALAPA